MKPRRVDWYPVDWLDGVATMPPDQRGVYDTIINLIYAQAAEDATIDISEHELAMRCCCHWRELRRILTALSDSQKVIMRQSCDGPAGVLRLSCTVKRCAEELHKARKRVAQARHNGSKGGRPNNLDKPDGFGNEKLARAPLSNHQTADSKRESKRGTRWPAGQPVDPAWIAEASAIRDRFGLSPVDAEFEAAQFVDHWLGSKAANAIKVDWHATWRKWIRNAHGINGNGSPHHQSSNAPSMTLPPAELLERLELYRKTKEAPK